MTVMEMEITQLRQARETMRSAMAEKERAARADRNAQEEINRANVQYNIAQNTVRERVRTLNTAVMALCEAAKILETRTGDPENPFAKGNDTEYALWLRRQAKVLEDVVAEGDGVRT